MNINTADQDPGRLGLYSGRASTYVGYKLREFIKNLIARKQTLDADTTKTASERFNIFINDGSLPFGTAFSPHSSHDNGKVLDIRPLGNAGATEQHYDFNAGIRRRRDIALLWAESAYRFDECLAYAADSPFRQTCLDNASSAFVAKYEPANGFGSFDAAKKRIVDWVNINQELGDIEIPGDSRTTICSTPLNANTSFGYGADGHYHFTALNNGMMRDGDQPIKIVKGKDYRNANPAEYPCKWRETPADVLKSFAEEHSE